MYQQELAVKIKRKAMELGFESCGIVRLEELRDYENMLKERIRECPNSKPMLEPLGRYANPAVSYDWAKAVIVCTTQYGKYKVPDNLQGLIGKYYLYDHKLQPDSEMNKNIVRFENYLEEVGIRAAKELHGVTSGRLAAYKAGLGIIRKNNFLYTKNGSWVIIDTWVIDHELELKEEKSFAECPAGCTKCIDACPTKALERPYCTDLASCITRLTYGIKDLPPEEVRKQMKGWIYGCDECQDACPLNKGTWQDNEEYPELDRLSEGLSLEKIFTMEESRLIEIMVPKFWFIRPESLWLWKVNALRAMANNYEKKYGKYILAALKDSDDKVRRMADWIAAILLQ